jgi:hypothetical protein
MDIIRMIYMNICLDVTPKMIKNPNEPSIKKTQFELYFVRN